MAPVADESLVTLGGADAGFDEAAVTSWVVADALRRLSPERRAVLDKMGVQPAWTSSG